MKKHPMISNLTKALALLLSVLVLAGTLSACSLGGASYKSDGSVTIIGENDKEYPLRIIGYDVNSKGTVSVYLMGTENFSIFHIIEFDEDIKTDDGVVLFPAGKHRYQQVDMYMINKDGEKVEPFLVEGYCGRGFLPDDQDGLGILMFAFGKDDFESMFIFEKGNDDESDGVKIPVKRLKIPDESKVYEDIDIKNWEMLSVNFED